MPRRRVFFGPCACVMLVTAVVRAQTGIYQPPETDVGVLQGIGFVGRSSVDSNLGRLGGLYTGRFVNPQSPYARPSSVFPSPMAPQPFPGVNRLANRARGNRDESRFSFRDRRSTSLATYESNKNQSFATRQEMIRRQLPDNVRYSGPLAEPAQRTRNLPKTPITRLLQRGN